MFSRCSVGSVPHVDVFLMYFGEEGDLCILLFRHLEALNSQLFLIKVTETLLQKKSVIGLSNWT